MYWGSVGLVLQGHSPCGECGLKSVYCNPAAVRTESLPMRGVWIEIVGKRKRNQAIKSLPMRGVWIEICRVYRLLNYCAVTPHAGSVD